MARKQHRYKSAERKDQIKEKILDIIYHEGLNKLSTRRLADRVGLSEGALFRHYPTKKAMIADIINDVKTDMLQPLRQIGESNGDPEKRLQEYICRTMDYLHSHKGITLLLFTEASQVNDAGLKSGLYEIFDFQKKNFLKIVEDGIGEGLWDETISVEHLAALYMGIPISLNIEMILKTEDFDYKDFCLQMQKLILKILKKR